VTNTDSHFIKTFSALIVGLAVFSVLLILLAIYMHSKLVIDDNPVRDAAIAARIAPSGAVYAGETGRAAQQAAEEAAARELASRVAFEGSLDGGMIYDRVCTACHGGSQAGGAPAPTKEAWAPRLAKGVDTLVKHAIEGFKGDAGNMPAKGGRLDLSDEQVRVSVEYMVAKYK
jgi:cytochrome c5